MNPKSILFISPDYHCSFFYRDELRKLGWKADIYVANSYPDKLLYSTNNILRQYKVPKFLRIGWLGIKIESLLRCFFYLTKLLKYKYHFYYGNFDQFSFFESKIGLNKLLGQNFRVHLSLAKFFNIKIINLPTGCLEEETKAFFSSLEEGNVCNNCGLDLGFCSDKKNMPRFDLIRNYADMVVGTGSLDSTQYKATHFKYKAIDLDLWRPDLHIPEKFRLPRTENIRVLHSFFNKNRDHNGKNIKGSPFIVDAIERLKQEGHRIEYFYVTDVQTTDMKYYQAQADIVVDQLIYGWWGSTFVETSALGKPVVVFLRPSWEKFFLKTFPEYNELSAVEATTDTIYEVLKKLVSDPEYRVMMGKKSRWFAETHFDIKKNALALSELLLRL